MQCGIYVGEAKIGEMGVVHPEVLKSFKQTYPTSLVELNFEKLVELYID